jgi:hypothetical protein
MRGILLSVFLIASGTAQDVAEPAPPDSTYRIVPRLGHPLGAVITVTGVVVEGPFKGYESGANLRVQQVQGHSSQEDRQIVLSTFLPGEDADKLTKGQTYVLEGYESGGFYGIPGEAYQKSGVMMSNGGFGFRHAFVYYKATPVEPIHWRPADLVGQRVILTGLAVNTPQGPALRHVDGIIAVTGVPNWEPWQLEKDAEALGIVQLNDATKTYTVQAEHARLVHLADCRGQRVSLRCIAHSRNGVWWVSYRGQTLHVDGLAQLPGWSRQLHYRPVEISGVLAEAEMPDVSQISIKITPDLKRSYVVRLPSWKPIDRLLQPERTDDTLQPLP